MRRIFIGTLVVLTIALINGCANRKITRVDPNETIDLSGRWNDSDSRLVSEEMIGDLLTSAWIPRYLKANDKRPVVVVGLVENKSHEHINSETFIKDVEKAIIRDGNIRLVVAGEKRNELRKERAEQQDYASPETTKKWGKELGADFILQGTINSIVDSYKKQKVVTYQIDLQLTNIETNVVVWMGDKKIKKQISDRVL
ncbi:MAG: penicillin-binding protein activator LpoB [Butyricimonas faecihominis]